MVTPEWVRTMARYNALMNADLCAAADGFGDEERRRDRGAFWKSMSGPIT